MLSRVAALLPSRTKERLKGWRKRLRLAYVRRWRGFGPDDLRAALRHLGVAEGQAVMVHSSFDQFAGFSGKATEVIAVLEEAVGATGTLLMPSLPFTGTAVEYVSQGPMFDARRTPSRVGLLTELFRRSPGVLRSTHPTHAVAAWGAGAAEMLANHHLARTPCGEGSPYARLLERDGRILFLGAGIESMTFFHYVEEVLEPDMPFSPFTREELTLSSKDLAGRVLESKTRLFDPAVSRRRDLDRLRPVLRQDGVWTERRLGELSMVLLEARNVLTASRRLAAQGVYCYDH
ncbi:MAG TPA: AAC(3) family N-acetyltransferase [Candidatus Limnocylindrales bacterium]|nr:AAC(3) family N-acetyltransferase [Candidatus Limnocylindrales bacterium]